MFEILSGIILYQLIPPEVTLYILAMYIQVSLESFQILGDRE